MVVKILFPLHVTWTDTPSQVDFEVKQGSFLSPSGHLAPNPSEQRNFTEEDLSRTCNGGKYQLSYGGNNADI
jgi:hypothetical protein